MNCEESLNKLSSHNVEDYQIEGLLNTIWDGRGKVVAARHIPTKTPLAIKIFDLENCADDLDLIQHEARTLRELRHPHVCAIGMSLSFGQEAWLVLPRFQCSAAALISTHFTLGLPELALALIARDVLLALQYLHSHCIIHRAVQSRHILISSSGRCALSGLRHSIEHRVGSGEGDTLHDYPRYPVSLLNWASPEMLHQDLRGYSYSSDVYSLGLTVCELANAEQPYQGLPPTLMMVEKLKGFVPFLVDASKAQPDEREDGDTASCASHNSNGGLNMGGGDNADADRMSLLRQRLFTASAHEFVKKTMALEPFRRPSVQQLLSSDVFIKQARKAANPSVLACLQLSYTDCLSTENMAAAASVAAGDLSERLAKADIDDTSWEFEAS